MCINVIQFLTQLLWNLYNILNSTPSSVEQGYKYSIICYAFHSVLSINMSAMCRHGILVLVINATKFTKIKIAK